MGKLDAEAVDFFLAFVVLVGSVSDVPAEGVPGGEEFGEIGVEFF